MDMTTKERIKALMGIDSTGSDDLIDIIIAGVSARFESLLGRHVTVDTYTEVYEVSKAAKVIWLRGYPIASITSMTYSSKTNDSSATLLVADDDYSLDADAGIVRLRLVNTPYNPGYLSVVYSGGMAANYTALLAAFPELVAAADSQVVHEWNRKRSPGGNLETRDGKTNFGQPEVNLLSGVRETLGMISRSII